MMKLWLAPLLALGIATLAPAQTVLFEEDFSSGLSRWSLTSTDGIEFQVFQASDTCADGVAPFPSGKKAVRAGSPTDCTFNTGSAPACTMTTVEPIDLPASAQEAWLTFWSYEEVECAKCGWDWRFVYVSADGGATWSFVGESDQYYHWYTKALDLTPWLGSSILLRFEFDAVDFWGNDGLGWVLDDIRVVADPWADPLNYCDAAPHSQGGPAVMGYSGTTSVSADDFVLRVDSAPADQYAHFFYGPGRTYAPAADGFLCVAPGATGFVRLLPSGKIDGNGSLTVPLDIAASLDGPAWITAGSTYRFQCWFRDPQGGPAGSNFSDGLRVVFKP